MVTSARVAVTPVTPSGEDGAAAQSPIIQVDAASKRQRSRKLWKKGITGVIQQHRSGTAQFVPGQLRHVLSPPPRPSRQDNASGL
jgi:hypothetical protein